MILRPRPASSGPQGHPGLVLATSSRLRSEVYGFQATGGSSRGRWWLGGREMF